MTSHTVWSARAPTDQMDWPVGVPAGLQAMVAIRTDLMHLDLQRVQDRIALLARWEQQLHREYHQIEWRLSESDRDFLRSLPVPRFLEEGGRGLSYALKGNWPTAIELMPQWQAQYLSFELDAKALSTELPAPLRLIWLDREDLQGAYPIDTSEGRFALLGWWLKFGHQEYARVRWSIDPALRAVVPHGDGKWPMPVFLSLIIAGRRDLSPELYGPVSDGNWVNALLWWHLYGCGEFDIEEWTLGRQVPLRRMMHQRVAEFEANRSAFYPCTDLRLPYPLFLVWSTRSDLPTLFDIKTPEGCGALLAWWEQNREAEYGSFPYLFDDPDQELTGMNILGYARSVIGIAEDVRMAVRSAETVGIPCSVIDVPMPGPAKLDHSLDDRLTDRARWPLSLVCLPPTEIIRLGMEGGRQLLEEGGHIVGAWHWELPVWPEHLMGVIGSVDEIWVFSEFVRNAFAGKTDKPVRKMPLAVELPAKPAAAGEQFGLTPKRFHFLIMFDGNSWLSRKNPVAAVQAFKRAFPNDPNVGLVIKAISLNRQSPGWQSVEHELQGDPRVTVIDRTLDRVELVQLMASCNAYVSLHRSEGFGRIIAESMLLGLPTVTTAFSGNVDFCREDTSFLVNGPMVPLTADDYILHQGQYWCDPDVSQAMEQMRRVVDDRGLARQIADRAQQLIQSEYSIEAVGKAYMQRMRELRAAGTI
ncbi:MAG: glycosyltransferase family 4 protein [Hydrogenophaga sp.]|nr:glycosyltransferase family 4 protein [Hydrogenophaga sp.]